jgi:F0F1-type ATP synthase delta subunit
MYEQYEAQLAAAEEQALAMRQHAQEEIARAKRQVLNETRAEISAMRDKAEEDVREARRQALYQHRQALGRLITDLSARAMRDAVSDEFQRASIGHFVEQLAALPAEEYVQPEPEEEAGAVRAQLISAGELDTDVRARIHEQIERLAGQSVVVDFETNSDLVAGATLRFADVLIDGSIAGRLANLQEQYVAELEQRKS